MMLCHAHASLLSGNKLHAFYSCGEPHAAAAVLRHRHPRRTDYFERALRESMAATAALPLPDATAKAPFTVKTNEFGLWADRLIMRKEEGGAYVVELRADTGEWVEGAGYNTDHMKQTKGPVVSLSRSVASLSRARAPPHAPPRSC
jgi:hypothetical protein